jgi:hypothetical protein
VAIVFRKLRIFLKPPFHTSYRCGKAGEKIIAVLLV